MIVWGIIVQAWRDAYGRQKHQPHRPSAGLRCGILAVLIAGFWPVWSPALAQISPSLYEYPRLGLDWYTIETEHFHVVFHADSSGAGSSRTAQVVARIAEEVYGPLTALYRHEPDTKVTFVLKDYEDYSNGAAYFFDNKIDIWAPALDSPLRGDHNWLRNVIAHEFTHIIQVQKTMRADRRLPFLYLQFLHYEDVKRPDVLYGYPNGILSYPIPMLNNPAWFAEGTAQFQRAGMGYDRWDAHRDMLLRTRVLAGREMSLAEMGGFYSHTSLLREGVYNHGFAFTQYLVNTYGEDALRRISEQLARRSNWNFEQAVEDALGVPGGEIYDAWMDTLRQVYADKTQAIRDDPVEGRPIEPEGFQNFYPRFSPDGNRVAYLSNRGEDYSRTALYVRDLQTGEFTSFDVGGAAAPIAYTCALGHAVVREAGGSIAWRPDGKAIAYARTRDTRAGYFYDDLYEVDLESGKSRRLTRDQRATAPAYAPDGSRIAFVRQDDGSTNLFLLDPGTGLTRPVTRFADGTQVSDPVWRPSGEWIYFARSARHGRDLYRVRPDGTDLSVVLATDADERSPAFGPDGRTLHFASDRSGIFNLYRLDLDAVPPSGIKAGDAFTPERLTNVVGGAFMPSVAQDGRIAFARYEWDGYKIALLDAPRPLPRSEQTAYTPPSILLKSGATDDDSSIWPALAAYDDTDLTPLAPRRIEVIRREGSAPIETGEALPLSVPIGKYKNLFTSFSFYPVLRLDQYVSRERGRLDAGLGRRSAGETLLRNTKAGAYFGSREILNGLNFFGGVLVGPASGDADSFTGFISPSNLLKLERDVFVQFDYLRGFGIIPQRWSPQLTVELFNIRRNVEQGLSIEEFPCTACLPDTSRADLSYNLWEANIALRSKVNRALLLEVGYRYSPYRVTTERFFSREANQTVDASSSRYYIGKGLRAKAYLEASHPYRNGDVVPHGLRAELGYEYEPGSLLDRFDVEDGILVPKYSSVRNHRLSLDARLGRRLPGELNGGTHGFGLRLRASTILGGAVDDFYNDYAGGLIGARGYPFYALGGNEILWLQASYTLPILPNIHRQFLFTYIDKLYGRLYADAASAWSGSSFDAGPFRKDVGAELRLGLGSFYLLPTAVFVSATYGLDAFDFELDEGFFAPDGSRFVRYGGQMQWHFGVLFSFDP